MSRDLSRRNAFGAQAERDRKLELGLKHELRAAGTPDRDACVDAETLGAWADGGLDAVQMASVELHVSTCARCQAIVGVAARSSPVIAAVAGEGGFRFPRWALAPVAAAAALIIWMVVPQDTMQAPPSSAPAPLEARKDAAPPAAAASAPTQGLPSQAKELADAAPVKPAASPETFAEGKRERTPEPRATLEERPQRAEERTAANIGAAAAAPPPPAAPAVADLMLEKVAVAPLVIVSPDASRRWRIANGAIERSEDGGASWVATRTLSGQTITGGTAPAGSICWLIGAGGIVMLTADGITFTEVPLPERVDLTAIAATDARTATVTTADGRRFRTDDSGRSWRQI